MIGYKNMSIAQHLKDEYYNVRNQFTEPKSHDWRPTQEYPELLYVSDNPSLEFFPRLIERCTQFYNELDSAVETLKITVPEVYNELQLLIQNRILGGLSDKGKRVTFFRETSSGLRGDVTTPPVEELPKGINSVIELLSSAMDCRINMSKVKSDEYYYTAWLSYRFLESSLMRFLVRLSYVMMYPHRIVLDRVVLETVLKKEGMDSVIFYVQSAEQHFNEKNMWNFAPCQETLFKR
jgi:hypothetical protein